MKKVLFIFGTRPEAIKLVPLIEYCRQHSAIEFITCITSQHKEMLIDVLSFFDIEPDYDLDIMTPNQNLYDLTGDLIKKLKVVFESEDPDYVIVQGDTTSAFVGALAAFYAKVPVVHVEAGLRSFEKYSPFPEELNRQFVSRIASYHFVPTDSAKEHLISEGINKNIHVVGNTVVDALSFVNEKLDKPDISYACSQALLQKGIQLDKDVALVTLHRRESFGQPLKNCCEAILALSQKYSHFQFVIPVHFNPTVQTCIKSELGHQQNICLIDPLGYPEFIYLMSKSRLILTDSGGIQEEAPSFGKPVIVLRDVTERKEGVNSGLASVVGYDKKRIIEAFDRFVIGNFNISHNPYGDGHSSHRIFDVLLQTELVAG